MASQLEVIPQHDNGVERSSNLPTNALTEWTMTREAWQHQLEQKEEQIRSLTSELTKVNEQVEMERAERERWAQFRHDAINQSLFSAGLIAEVLPRLWERDQSAARKSLEDLRRLTFGVIAEMRVLLIESRPSLLRDSEMGELLSFLGNMVAGRLNIPVEVDISEKTKLPAEVQASVYTLSKEILNQITRRAKAEKISIKLVHAGPNLSIHIAENGDNIAPASLFATADENLISALKKAKAHGVDLQFGCQLDGQQKIAILWQSPVEK